MTGISPEEKRNINLQKKQNVVIIDRHVMNLTGVEDVISFDENAVVMKTLMGNLTVDGKELHIVRLDIEGGDVTIEGSVNGLFYSEQQTGNKDSGRFKRWFR